MAAEAVVTFTKIKEHVEEIKNDREQRFPEAASPGDYWRQGDLYVTLLKGIPSNYKPCAVEQQVVPGTTQGSRHILSHTNVEMFKKENANVLEGPAIKVAEEVTLTHPEHGNVVLGPGCYNFTYQRAFAEELKRQLD